jgi:hypothetical protein
MGNISVSIYSSVSTVQEYRRALTREHQSKTFFGGSALHWWGFSY